jgi:hypothetical protein
MSGDFIDIEIVDLDISRTSWSRVHTSMRTVYLKLSREPDVLWTRHFLEERAKRINPKRHGLWIEDDYIVIDCFVEEVERYHLPDLRLSVAYANQKGHEEVGQRRSQAAQSIEDKRNEKDELEALRASIRGAAPAPPETPADAANEAAAEPSTIESAFARKRDEWQARFRAALAFRKKEPSRGND